ncbi:MAG TPA: hypothetical protein VGQ57_00900 [Polyangiaceae bacterium]|nr:hypothetical protein [Polyangiaceae bacterium]
MAQTRTTGPRRFLALLAFGLGLGAAGCYAEAGTSAVVATDAVPAHYEVYPHEYYEGRVVYLIGDRWYYSDGPRWVYYEREPEVLVRRRVVIQQSAPVVRERPVVHQAPPAHREVHEYRYHEDPARRHAERRAPRAE